GVRSDIDVAAGLPMFWIKLAFPASIAVASVLAVSRLSRPGVRLGGTRGAIIAPVLFVWLYAAWVLLGTPSAERADLVMGRTWKCGGLGIPPLSVPAVAAALWAMKGLAPTRLALAGAGAGLLAGAVAALIYALHCPEMEAPFLGVWYVAGMLIPAAAGALLGP